MAKIESIRPGGTLEASFVSYPLAELLIGILRGNLSGRLDIFLHPEPRNHMVFRNGVPIVVELPDSGGSLVQILIEAGALPRDRGLDLLRLAEASGRSQAALIEQHKLLSRGALHEALNRLARSQVVRLFDVRSAEFRFVEGVVPDPSIAATILQPLPIVYEGLVSSKDDEVVGRFVEENGACSFVLSATYPHGVDPFEWGTAVERAITPEDETVTIELLVERGLTPQIAAAAIMSAYLAGMMEMRARNAVPDRRRAEQPVEDPRLAQARRAVRPEPDGVQRDPSGLVIHRRSKTVPAAAQNVRPEASPVTPLEPTLPPPPRPPAEASAHDLEYTAVRDRLAPLRNQNYYQMLRITAGTDGAQLDRAYRFLLRRLEDDLNDEAARCLRDILTDAFDVLRDRDRAKRYGELVELGATNPSVDRDRRAFEAEPKVERAFRAMATNNTGVATYLLSWAEKQDSARTDIPILFAMIDYLRASPGQRVMDGRALESLIEGELAERGHDWRVRLCFGLLLAEREDVNGATRNIQSAPDPEHPMVRRIAALISD